MNDEWNIDRKEKQMAHVKKSMLSWFSHAKKVNEGQVAEKKYEGRGH